jgi:hypothetical protein
MKFMSKLSFDIRHSLFIIRYSFLVVALPRCGQVCYFSSIDSMTATRKKFACPVFNLLKKDCYRFFYQRRKPRSVEKHSA